ncbi:MAG: DNA/RNA non-specific endonuclease [Sphingomonadales bacterium]
MLKQLQQFFVKPFILFWIAAFFLGLNAFIRSEPKLKRELPLACPRPLTGEEIVPHIAYSLSYNEQHKQANWVAYMLIKTNLGNGVERSNRFTDDPLVAASCATNADYAKSGYDRGHLAPAADMSWSIQVMKESFYYSNVSPQLPGFNRGIWKILEEKVRQWAAVYDTVYVVTGPILEQGLPTIGPQKVSVPKAYFKALIAPRQQKGIAFLLPNSKSDASVFNYSITIDALEGILKRDLFFQLPDDTEEKIEGYLHVWP